MAAIPECSLNIDIHFVRGAKERQRITERKLDSRLILNFYRLCLDKCEEEFILYYTQEVINVPAV